MAYDPRIKCPPALESALKVESRIFCASSSIQSDVSGKKSVRGLPIGRIFCPHDLELTDAFTEIAGLQFANTEQMTSDSQSRVLLIGRPDNRRPRFEIA